MVVSRLSMSLDYRKICQNRLAIFYLHAMYVKFLVAGCSRLML